MPTPQVRASIESFLSTLDDLDPKAFDFNKASQNLKNYITAILGKPIKQLIDFLNANQQHFNTDQKEALIKALKNKIIPVDNKDLPQTLKSQMDKLWTENMDHTHLIGGDKLPSDADIRYAALFIQALNQRKHCERLLKQISDLENKIYRSRNLPLNTDLMDDLRNLKEQSFSFEDEYPKVYAVLDEEKKPSLSDLEGIREYEATLESLQKDVDHIEKQISQIPYQDYQKRNPNEERFKSTYVELEIKKHEIPKIPTERSHSPIQQNPLPTISFKEPGISIPASDDKTKKAEDMKKIREKVQERFSTSKQALEQIGKSIANEDIFIKFINDTQVTDLGLNYYQEKANKLIHSLEEQVSYEKIWYAGDLKSLLETYQPEATEKCEDTALKEKMKIKTEELNKQLQMINIALEASRFTEIHEQLNELQKIHDEWLKVKEEVENFNLAMKNEMFQAGQKFLKAIQEEHKRLSNRKNKPQKRIGILSAIELKLQAINNGYMHSMKDINPQRDEDYQKAVSNLLVGIDENSKKLTDDVKLTALRQFLLQLIETIFGKLLKPIISGKGFFTPHIISSETAKRVREAEEDVQKVLKKPK